MLLVLAFLVLCIDAQNPGVAVQFDPKPVLAVMNRERAFWKVPILEYDNDIAQIAQYYCELCNWPEIPKSEERGPILGRLKGFKYDSGKKYQSTGETRAASAGPGADPSPNQWLNRQDWNCNANSCNASSGCDAYKQVIWKDTTYVGCGKCRCNTTSDKDPFPNDNSPVWDFLLCQYNSAGNYAGEHPFGSDKSAVCAGTYVVPPYNPQPVCKKCNTGCVAPVQGATCNSGTGAWESSGTIAISQISKPVDCDYVINGDLTGSSADRLNVSWCGGVSVKGKVTFSGDVGIELDYDGVAGLVPGSFKSFINYTSPITGGGWKPPLAREVAAPLLELCAITVQGDKGSGIYLYDCADQTAPGRIPAALPNGAGNKLSQSGSTVSFNPVNPNLGGDINDPNLNTEPKGGLVPPPGSGNGDGGSGSSLPGWAIFLIVLAVIIGIAVLVAIIFFLATSGDSSERF